MYRLREMLVIQMALVILAGLSQLTFGQQLPLIFAGMVPLNIGDMLSGHVEKVNHRATSMPTTAVCDLLCEHHLGGTACNCQPEAMTTPVTPMPTTDVCAVLCEMQLGGMACNCNKPEAMTTPVTPMPTTDVCALLCEMQIGGMACNCKKPERRKENTTTIATAVTTTTKTIASTTKPHVHGNRLLDDLSQFLSGNGDHPGGVHHEGTTRASTITTRRLPTPDVCEVLCEKQVGGIACNCNRPGVPG